MSDPHPRGAIAPSATAPFDVPVTPRNPGMPLELDWIEDVRVNRSAVERRTSTLRTRRTVKKEWQAAWLLRAVTLMDLTTLAGDDTPGRVRRLCAKARRPVREDLLEAMGATQLPIRVGAVCVYHTFVETALEALEGSGIPVAAVSTGFPAGLSPLAQRLGEIRASVAAGAEEIDVVITRAYALTENWRALYDEVRAMREACGDAHIKTILATGELGTLRTVGRASLVCMMAGADFFKSECHAARGAGDGSRDPRIPRAHRASRRPQAGGRHPCGEGIARLARSHQGGAGRPLAPARSVSLRRQLPPHRCRASARALRDRALLGGVPTPDGVISPFMLEAS
jgi:deoxyribose-phosphate aldolase